MNGPFDRRGRKAGFSLVEVMVVLTITALLAALVAQALGLFAARYESLRRLEAQTTQQALPRNWFATTVRGFLPYRIDARRFTGDVGAFRGFTTESLGSEPGLPVAASWRIEPDGGRSVVSYHEEGGLAWQVLVVDAPAAFQYADAALVWRNAWPVEELPFEHVPTLVRLVTIDGETLWLGRLGAYPEAIGHPEDFS